MTIPLARGNSGRVVLETLAAARRPLLFLDLDGTLAPIVDRPLRARIPRGTAHSIRRLRATGVRVVLVSGRSIATVLQVAHTPVDAILGDHGARVYENGRLTGWLPASAEQFTHAADRLERMLEGTHGIRFVRKERSLAIHLRLPKNDKGRTSQRIARMLRKEGLRVLFGHRILDAQLPGVNKGRAVLKWVRRHPYHDVVLYAGDDTTDEDAMLALAGRAFTVAVGSRPRYSTYRTSSPRTFAAWLSRLADARMRVRGRRR